MKGCLVLEDGTVFPGMPFGAPGTVAGEVVFNTSMTGYQEVLTDPSYFGQIVTMTYPLIGNYGINDADVESDKIQVQGFVVREACRYPSNFSSRRSLGDYLISGGIIGLEQVDTRALTRHIRLAGAMKSVIYAGESGPDVPALTAAARAWEGLDNRDVVREVTCKKAYRWNESGEKSSGVPAMRFKVVAFDFGIKYNILRILQSLGCDVTVVPAATTAKDVLAFAPDGVFLSNGPGDPGGVTYAIETIRQLVGKVPVFGICLGHQLIGLALGGKRFKLKFGHHGANHPVRNEETKVIEITSQNHNYCIDIDSLKSTGATLTHLNLNDTTCEGISDVSRRIFSVQYHPEASPGPHDSGYLFAKFIDMMEKKQGKL